MKKITLPISLLIFLAINSATAQFEEQTGTSIIGTTGKLFWGDYNNDSFFDVLIIGDTTNSHQITKVYKNNGNETFTEQTGVSLIDVSDGFAAWGDLNNDGFLDIVLSGYSDTRSKVTIIYKNNGDGTFIEQTENSLIGVQNGSIALGDYNNDGWLDILLAGNSQDSNISRIYKNNGDGTFSEQTDVSLTGIASGSVAWGDYDNDGFNDILLTASQIDPITKIYKNNGDGTFAEQTIFQSYGYSGKSDWYDYDNDGFLDILLTCNNPEGYRSKLYKNNKDSTFKEQLVFVGWTEVFGDFNNDGFTDIIFRKNNRLNTISNNNGDGTFSEQAEIGITDILYGSATSVDYNNDGLLDLILNGCKINNNDNYKTKIFKNTWKYSPNTPPLIPTNLQDSVNFNTVILKWDRTSDAQTLGNGLSYNIRIGTTPGGDNIINPMSANTNGYRRINCPGNAGQKNDGILIRNLPAGTYYWSVQAIDNAFAGGPWASENTFNITAVQATNLKTDSIGLTGMKLSCTNGSGTKRILFMAEGRKSAIELPLNSITYNANISFGAGSQIGSSGWYCIYNGTNDSGNKIEVTNLKEYTDYSVVVYEYTGDPVHENYNTSTFKDNTFFARTKGIFEEQTNIFLIGLKNSSVTWGDYNNDSFLDILIAGDSSSSGNLQKPATVIYKNNGNGTFTKQTEISLTGVTNGSVDWGDYNNDGWLDIALTGDTSISESDPLPVSEIYTNKGDGTFSKLNEVQLTGLFKSSLVWKDFNNDGLLDLALGGIIGNYYVAKIYKNNGSEAFSEQTILELDKDLGSLNYRPGKISISTSDWNNDGYTDILLALYINPNQLPKAKIFKNNGDGTFVKQTEITGLRDGSIAWGDYNNDGLEDIISSAYYIGAPQSYGSKIYKNNGDGTFSEQTGISLPGTYESSVAWTDYNNDGYMDILSLSGPINSYQIPTRMYKNNGNETFSLQNGTSFPNLRNASITWGDFDNDNYMDVLLSGFGTSKIYKNIGNYSANSIPNTPVNLQQKVNFNNVKLKWDKASDAQTPQDGLKYNIRVGSNSGICDVVNPMSSPTGRRQTPTYGNAGPKNDTLTLNLPAGTYYWSVQTIDNSYAGGTWSNENSFTIISQQASKIALDSISLNGMKLSWANGNGDKRIVFVRKGNTMVNSPLNNITYSANSNFGVGNQIDTSGWYCVYNGKGNEVLVSGLKEATSYKIAVFEYWGEPGSEKYNFSAGTGNILLVQTKKLFEEQINIPIFRYNQALAWGDYNNDGWIDLIATGDRGGVGETYKYTNNGDGTFTSQHAYGKRGSNLAWGDFNNDNYLDLALSYGGQPFGPGTILFENIQNLGLSQKSFTLGSGSPLTWRDYNYDGLLDLQIGSEAIYKNNGDETFSLQTGISLPVILPTGIDYNNDGVSDSISSEKWCDYNNDGYLDKLVGYTIYKNNGVYAPFGKNTPPNAPANLKGTINFNNPELYWNKAYDDITPQDELSYNVRIGTTPGGYDIVSPEASIISGFRWKPASGNAGNQTQYSINNLHEGTYYWSVQAIDRALAGGAWATESTFVVTPSTFIDSAFLKKTSIYPNPTRDYFKIVCEKSEPCFVTITDIQGKNVLSQPVTTKEQIIFINNLENGLYIVKLQTSKVTYCVKLIVE